MWTALWKVTSLAVMVPRARVFGQEILPTRVTSFGSGPKIGASSLRSLLQVAAFWALTLGLGGASARVVEVAEIEVQFGLQQLSSSEAKDRYWGAVVLGRYPEFAERTLRPLRQALEDSDWAVRLSAARALESFGPRAHGGESTAALVRRLEDASSEVQTAAAFALAAVGGESPEARSQLALLRQGRSTLQRVAAMEATVALELDELSVASRASTAAEAIALLRGCMSREAGSTEDEWEDAPCERAGRLARAASRLHAQTAYAFLPELVASVDSEHCSARHAARSMAPFLGPFEADLMRRIRHGSAASRGEAAIAAGLLGLENPATLTALSELVAGGGEVAVAGLRALEEIGESARPAVPAIERIVRSAAPDDLRRAAGRALTSIDWDRAGEVADELRDEDPEFSAWLRDFVVLSVL
ncbi:MAG: hypothetical protein AMXMBFR36_25670 [Acidobacteriota bacterium]